MQFNIIEQHHSIDVKGDLGSHDQSWPTSGSNPPEQLKGYFTVEAENARMIRHGGCNCNTFA